MNIRAKVPESGYMRYAAQGLDGAKSRANCDQSADQTEQIQQALEGEVHDAKEEDTEVVQELEQCSQHHDDR